MFDHVYFDNYSFEEIPIEKDICFVDEAYLRRYEKMMLRLFAGDEWEPVCSVNYTSVRAVTADQAELSWYANVCDRFHEISVVLPRDKFIACVGSRYCDEKVRIFVRSEWLQDLYLRNYSVFALVDAIGVRDALAACNLSRDRLVDLRGRIDGLANTHKDVSFISFADSLLIKSNWSVGDFKNDVKYSYAPENFVYLANEIDQVYRETLGLSTYAVITQGSNEYYQDALLHISNSQNHVCLNSLGIPFSQLMDIEVAARVAIRENVHPPFELYMDEQYYHTINFESGFDKWSVIHQEYRTKMMATPSQYFCMSRSDLKRHMDVG